jgi:UDP-N-acetylmuramate--alanine ligase
MKKIKGIPNKIFIVGMGGSGVSGFARILNSYGYIVSGSDANDSNTIKKLQASGIGCLIGHRISNIPKDTELLIYSPAIPKNNNERKSAEKLGIQQLSYPEALGLFTKMFYTVAVCGTHGKTTTTALLAEALIKNGSDPTVLLGSTLKELNGFNNRIGEGKHFIVEACEYKRAFLNYHPSAIIVTNIEADHLDYYKNLKDYCSAYKQFIERLPPNGLLIVNIDDKNLAGILKKSKKTVTYGTAKQADYRLKDGKILHENKIVARLDLKIPGIHNQFNAAAVIALANELKLDIKKSVIGINSYLGAERRFEIKGKIGKTIIIDDYAHHPTEIKATLKSLKEKYGRNKKVLCVFQPHQYNRTLNLLDDFARAFIDADEVIIPNIFKVRDKEADIKKMNEEMFVNEIARHHPKVSFGNGLENTKKLIQSKLLGFDIVITLGAGDINKLADALIK